MAEQAPTSSTAFNELEQHLTYLSIADKHQGKIQAGDVDIVDTPVSVNVRAAGGKPLKVIAGVNRPRGIAVNKDGTIAVAEGANYCIMDTEGRKVRSFGWKRASLVVLVE